MKCHFERPGLVVLLLCAVGCPPNLFDEIRPVPTCDEHGGTGAECPGPSSTGGSSGAGATPTTTGEDPIQTTTETAPAFPDLGSDESTGSTGELPEPPMIVDVDVDPEMLMAAAPVGVHVEALNALEVTMALDGGEPVTLAASGANLYTGSIEVLGASMNGDHTIEIAAFNAGLVDVAQASFTVDAPPPGSNIWLKTSDTESQTRAIAVDAASNVYPVGTSGAGTGARLIVGKRDEFGNHAWPGKWFSYIDGESRGEDVAIGPDGHVYVLANYKDKDSFTRWWLAKLDPAAASIVGDPQLGEVKEPARGLSVSAAGDVAIVGHATVWGAQQTEDVQTKVWLRPVEGPGVIAEWGHAPDDKKNGFTEMPEDVLVTADRIFVTGSAEGFHTDAQDQDQTRKRLFLVELNFKGEVVREYVAPNTPYPRSGGYALAGDGKGGLATAGWACAEACTQTGEILWFAGDGPLEPYQRQEEMGFQGPAYALDIAYSPAGYNVVASAVSIGAGLNLGLRVTGRRPDVLMPVFDYSFDTVEVEMGQAVAVGPSGYVWYGGLRMLNNAFRAVVGRSHG